MMEQIMKVHRHVCSYKTWQTVPMSITVYPAHTATTRALV